ncbi:hypothetical protein OQ496_06685 [Acetobacter suratthaniensis]|nr:hypothetical protein [Acetobacter suratthaniensis]
MRISLPVRLVGKVPRRFAGRLRAGRMGVAGYGVGVMWLAGLWGSLLRLARLRRGTVQFGAVSGKRKRTTAMRKGCAPCAALAHGRQRSGGTGNGKPDGTAKSSADKQLSPA